MANRKQTEKVILAMLKELTHTDLNSGLYKDLFASMNDKEFDELISDIESGKRNLQLLAPHEEGKIKVTYDGIVKFLVKYGRDPYQYITYKGMNGEPDIRSKYKFLIMTLPVRRTKQTIEKGISVSEDSKHTDVLTGQSVGDSRSSRISLSETQVLAGMGLPEAASELAHDRGGDIGARTVIKNAITKYGSVSDELIRQYSTGVVSSQTLKSYFNAMHYKINL